MPIETQWYDDARSIIIYRVSGSWGASDIHAMAAEVGELVLEVEHTVDLISDFSEAGRPPADILHLARHLTTNQPPQFGNIAVVGMPPYLDVALKVLKRVYPRHLNNIFAAKTLSEAEQLLEEYRLAAEKQVNFDEDV